jgi:hypothetical protein
MPAITHARHSACQSDVEKILSDQKSLIPIKCCFVIRAADFKGLVNETEVMGDVSMEMFSMSVKIKEVTHFARNVTSYLESVT